MRRTFASLLVAFVLAGSPAWSATALESARSTATQARSRVSEVRGRQMSLRTELNRLAAKIETLKAQQQGSLITGGELDASLRRSQELSGSLTEAAQQLAQAESELERENLALLSALTGELDGLRAQWDRTQDRGARAQIVSRMKALRLERDQVRAMLPASKVPALQGAGSDDPEELLEQADALRDSEDKVRQRMKALQTRIAEVREERELDRRMSDFLGDEAMFDDEDRRLRRTLDRGEVTRQGMPPLFGGPESTAASDAAPPAEMSAGAAESSMAPENERTADQSTSAAKTAPITVTQRVKGADSRPQVGGMDSLLLESGDSDDLETLEAQLQKLESYATQLDARADEIEQRAKDLE